MGTADVVLTHLTTAAQALCKAFGATDDPIAAEIIGRASVFTGSAIEQVIHPIEISSGGVRTAPNHAGCEIGGEA